jgi:hypothetical protein
MYAIAMAGSIFPVSGNAAGAGITNLWQRGPSLHNPSIRRVTSEADVLRHLLTRPVGNQKRY